MENNLVKRAKSTLQKMDTIVQSRTFQELKPYAPLIVQSFKELSIIEKGLKHEVDMLRASRENDYKKFHDIAPGMMQNLKSILDEIFKLQKEVRSLAGRTGEDPNAQSMIEYTERHLRQLLDVFQGLSFQLLNY